MDEDLMERAKQFAAAGKAEHAEFAGVPLLPPSGTATLDDIIEAFAQIIARKCAIPAPTVLELPSRSKRKRAS